MDTENQQPESDAGLRQPPLEGKYVSIERRSPVNNVFQVDDVVFHSSMPPNRSWAVGWADLMMTMFILFLTMYAYKAADQEFLGHKGLEVIGGDTSSALEMDRYSKFGPPITPIAPGLPLMTGGTIKKAETVTLRDTDLEAAFSSATDKTRTEKVVVEVPADRVIPPQPETAPGGSTKAGGKATEGPDGGETVEPDQLLNAGQGQPDKIQEIYRLSKTALESNDLKSFATVDLIPDNTMRIILTGDLLFDTGQASLSEDSRKKLEKLATGIQSTPYMINVVGHTDNVPMYSGRYASNWDLSVARASTVARFLIEEMGMDANQFVVSGYASQRPLVPNSTAENRKMNRRVEIIISKRLPNPQPADQQNLK